MAPVCSPLVVVRGGSAWNARNRKFSASTMNRLGFAAEVAVDVAAEVETERRARLGLVCGCVIGHRHGPGRL